MRKLVKRFSLQIFKFLRENIRPKLTLRLEQTSKRRALNRTGRLNIMLPQTRRRFPKPRTAACPSYEHSNPQTFGKAASWHR
jgi:hypothetical protein